MYHNTTQSTQPELKQYREKAKSQEDVLLGFFKQAAPVTGFSPSQLLRLVFKGSVPITSVRRTLTNLTDEGHLVKTNKQIEGPYGRPEFLWRLSAKYKQREMF